MELLSEISVPSDACCGACLLELNEVCDEASLTFSWWESQVYFERRSKKKIWIHMTNMYTYIYTLFLTRCIIIDHINWISAIHMFVSFPFAKVCSSFLTFFCRLCSIFVDFFMAFYGRPSALRIAEWGVRGEPLQRTLAPAHPACCSIGRPRKNVGKKYEAQRTKMMQNDARCARGTSRPVKILRFCMCGIVCCIQTMSLELSWQVASTSSM